MNGNRPDRRGRSGCPERPFFLSAQEISAMTTYTAHFFTEADWAKTMITADTPELALQRARQIESEETETLDFQSYDTTTDCFDWLRAICWMLWRSHLSASKSATALAKKIPL